MTACVSVATATAKDHHRGASRPAGGFARADPDAGRRASTRQNPLHQPRPIADTDGNERIIEVIIRVV
jgi:hypothetical protein